MCSEMREELMDERREEMRQEGLEDQHHEEKMYNDLEYAISCTDLEEQVEDLKNTIDILGKYGHYIDITEYI